MLGIYLATVGISTVVQVLSNKSAADTIRRNGYEIDNSKTSGFEKFSYFIEDYFYLCVPIYNLYKSIIKNRIKIKPHEYVDLRFQTYSNRGMLEEIKKEEPVKVVEKVKEVKKEDKPVVTTTAPQKAVTKEVDRSTERVLPPRVESAFASKQEELTFCKSKLNSMISEYNKAEAEHVLPYAQRKAMYDNIISYQEHIAKLKKFIAKDNELEAIKKQRDELEAALRKDKIKGLN